MPSTPSVAAPKAAHRWEQASIPPMRTPPAYLLALFIVAVLLVALAIAYIALIIATLYFVYLFATDIGLQLFESRVGLWRLLAYVTPIVAGACVLLALVKPVFARRVKALNLHTLTREQEPQIYDFAERLAFAVGAPPPREICVSCDVNASAGFRRGVWSFLGSDLVLRIGMPLVAGLNAQQLAGVLAHELGHFAQGAGMRLSFLVRMINTWFARIVYERDSWDEKLIEISEANFWVIQTVFLMARLAVWLSRGLLWMFMMTSHALSSALLRQMEFDADRFEAQLAGSECFESVIKRLAYLSAAEAHVLSQTYDAYAARRLGDNLPQLIVAAAQRVPDQVRNAIDKSLVDRRTRLFDSHPSNVRRVARAKALNAPGIYADNRPARVLFRNFEVLCKWTTLAQYESILGRQVRAEELVLTKSIVVEQQVDEKAFEAGARYLQKLVVPNFPVFPQLSVRANGHAREQLIDRISIARQSIQQSAECTRDALSKLSKLRDHTDNLRLARALISLEVKPRIADLSLPHASFEQIERSLARVQQEQQKYTSAVRAFHATIIQRIECAVALLGDPSLDQKLKSASLRTHLHAIQPALTALKDCQDEIETIRQKLVLIVGLMQTITADGASIGARVFNVSRDLHLSLGQLRGMLRDTPAPFSQSRGSVSMGAFAVELMPPQDALERIVPCASQAVDRMHSLYMRLICKVALVCEVIERSVGLSPLEPPKDDPNASETSSVGGAA